MSLCTNCGKPLDEGAMFCTSCGSPVARAAASPAAVAGSGSSVAAVAPATTVEYPSPNFSLPKSSNSNLPKMLMIVVVVVVIGIGSTLFLLSRIHGGDSGPRGGAAAITVSGSGNSESEAFIRSLNLAAYPGARAAAVTSDSGENVIAAFQTRDTPQQVVQYYKVRFPISDTVGQDGQSELRATLANGQHIVVRATQQSSGTRVDIVLAP